MISENMYDVNHTGTRFPIFTHIKFVFHTSHNCNIYMNLWFCTWIYWMENICSHSVCVWYLIRFFYLKESPVAMRSRSRFFLSIKTNAQLTTFKLFILLTKTINKRAFTRFCSNKSTHFTVSFSHESMEIIIICVYIEPV